MKKLLKRLLWRPARRFIAGTTMPRALKTARKFNKQSAAATIDILGEECRNRGEVQKAFEKYKKLILAIFSRPSLRDTGISLKLSHFGLAFDKKLCEEIVRELVRDANARSIFVWVDMESDKYFRDILDIALRLRKDYPNIGVAYQAYRKDAGEYLQAIIKSGIAVRLCKGAYRESGKIIYKSKEIIRLRFFIIAAFILGYGKNHLAIATHDKFLINKCLFLAENLPVQRGKISSRQPEFQMLLGLEKESQRLKNSGFQTTVYIPFGKNWFPYVLRRIREKPLQTILMFVKSFKKN